MEVGSFPLYEFSSALTDQNSLLQSDQEIRLAEALVLALQEAKSMDISVKNMPYTTTSRRHIETSQEYCSCAQI